MYKILARIIAWAVIITALITAAQAGANALKQANYKQCIEKQTEGDGSKCQRILRHF